MTKRLTELACDRARPVPGKRVELYDGAGGVPGLALRITERGVKSWSLYYRVGGRLRRLTLGRFPDVALAEARRRARQALEQADRGVDPAGPVERRRDCETVAEVARDYLVRHVQRNKLRTAGRVEQMLRGSILPHWGDRPIRSITKRDALDLVDDVAARAPYMANRVQSLAKRLFSWAAERSILDAYPLAGMRPPVKERSRSRVLDDRELAAVWRAASELGWPFGEITKLLMLTAARRSEVAGMRWSELDLERKVWIKAAERTKSNRAHELPLSAAALAIIEALPRVDGATWTFPARNAPGPATGLAPAKKRLDRLSGVAGWRYHDLRRSAVSGMARLGHAPHIISAVLDHSPASVLGVTAIYLRHKHTKEVAAALEAWADHVVALATGPQSGKILKIR